jgi:hypothetical protein
MIPGAMRKGSGKTVNRPPSVSHGVRRLLLLSGISVLSFYLVAEIIFAETMVEHSSSRLITALGEKGYHDTAVSVLDKLVQNKAVSNAFHRKIPLLRAIERVASVRKSSDWVQRIRAFEEAREELECLLEEQQEHSLLADAAFQLGMVFLDTGRLYQNSVSAKYRDLSKAHEFFILANEVFVGPRTGQTALNAVENEIQDVDKLIRAYRNQRLMTPGDRRALTQLEQSRETLRGRQMQIQLLAAETFSEMAECFKQHSEEWVQSLEQALQRYLAVYEAIPNRSAGLWARLEEGKTLLLLGRKKEGQEVLLEVTKLPSSEGLIYQLRVKAVDELLSMWLGTANIEDDEGFDERLRQFVLSDSSASLSNPDRLSMKCLAAELLWRRFEASPTASKSTRDSLLADVRVLARDVAKTAGVHAASARRLLVKLGRKDAAFAGRLSQSFMASYQHAEEVLAQYRKNPTDSKRSESIAELQQVLRKATAQSAEDEEQKRKQLSLLRYQLALLFYEEKRYHEAVSIGELLTKSSSFDLLSKQAAVLTLATWQALSEQNNIEWCNDAVSQVGDTASYIMHRWPRDQCSTDAAEVSIDLAVREGSFEAIIAVIQDLAEGSPGRDEVLLRGGVSMWHLCQNMTDEQAGRTSLSRRECTHRAIRVLDEGLGGIGRRSVLQGTALEVAVAAAIARCEIAVSGADKGSLDLFSLLNQVKYGPWRVLRDSSAKLPLPVYEPGLRACLQGFVKVGRYDLARQSLAALLVTVSSSQEARLRLVGTCIAIVEKMINASQERKEQESSASPRGKASGDEAELLGELLDFVKDATPQIEVLSWVAITFGRLGVSDDVLGTDDVLVAGVRGDKRNFFLEQSAATIRKILTSSGLRGDAQTAWRRELVSVRSNLGQWDDAVKQMRVILSDQKNARSPFLQQDAAKLFQKAAKNPSSFEQSQEYFRTAVAGSRVMLTTGESVVWGWGVLANRISKVAFGDRSDLAESMRRLYFESRLSLAACRLEWAQSDIDAVTKVQLLHDAEAGIKMESQLHPDLGGIAFKKRFEVLHITIQQEFLKIQESRQ